LRLHPAFPIIWSSIVFSSVHFPFHSPLMIIGTFILGLWWSYSTIKQQSIIPVSISHAVLGALILLLALF
jgi:membrane protease YdiL (CAAX protease family)